MQWYEILILSLLEMISVLLIWSKLNKKIDIFSKESFSIIFVVLSITFVFFIYKIDIGFVISYVILCAMIIVLFKLSVQEIILQFFIVLSIITSIQFLFIYFLSLFKVSRTISFSNGIIVNIAIIIISIIINKLIKLDKVQQYLLKYRNYITLILVNITGVILLLIYIWRINEDFVEQYIAYLLLVILLWEGINIFFLYQSIRIKEQQRAINIHEKYTPFLKSMVHEVRQNQHDFKNHLNVLYGLAQNEEDKQVKEEIKEYLEKLIDNIKSTDKLLNIKDQVLSAIIYSKKALAGEKGICFELEFQSEIPEYPLEKYELVELLGNLLDNAIEAAEDTNYSSNPRIILILGLEGKSKIIKVKNTGGTLRNQDINKIFKRGFSTKEGKHRGYGLYNVKQLVKNYNGTIELSFEDSYTVFKILF